jgi:thiol:disulfide interchange protein
MPHRAQAHPRQAFLPALVALIALLAAAGGPSFALLKPEKAKLALQADRAVYAAGATARVAALVSIESGWHVNSHKPSFDYLIPTNLELALPAGWTQGAVRYPPDEMKRFTFAEQALAVYDGDVTIEAEVAIPARTGGGAYPLSATLTYQACNDSQCLPPVTTRAAMTVKVGTGGAHAETNGGGSAHPISSVPAHQSAAGHSSGAASKSTQNEKGSASLAAILLLALAGGLILNAMPCVLPVLSLKVFGLMRSAAEGRREIVRGGLATVAGIMVSFWALAGIAAASAAAGTAAGWGVQFQRPGFVAFLAVVIVLFCLNLWGLFEIRLPQTLTRVPGAAPREGLAGHFASGLFATLMATPCSAPFLGTALGFALTQRLPVIFAVFTAVGLGMSLPYLLLAAAPGAARFFPRPGAWMETLRGAMGFLLAGSAIWLLYVLAAQVSPDRVALFELGLIALALVVWLQHRARSAEPAADALPSSATAGGLRQAGARVAGYAVTAGVAAVLIFGIARGGSSAGARSITQSPGLIRWVNFDRGRAEALAASGQLVFVDVTAEWCFTCKVNERWVLDTPEVASAFSRHNVLAMRADWTNRDDRIAGFLAEHGRYGIPFYLLYRPGQSPYVFSEVPTRQGVVRAVSEAAAMLTPAAAPRASQKPPAAVPASSS